MEEQKIYISKEDYDEYVIYQYLQGKLKSNLNDEMASIKHEIEQEKMLFNELKKNKEVMLELFFKKNKMGTDSRAEQTDLNGAYAGFDKDKIELLYELGYASDDLVQFVNEQWDIRERPESDSKENGL